MDKYRLGDAYGDRLLVWNDTNQQYEDVTFGKTNVQSNWDCDDITSDAYILNKPSIPTVSEQIVYDIDNVYDTKDTVFIGEEEVSNPNKGKSVRNIIEENEAVHSAAENDLDDRIGDLNDLVTTNKDNLVEAINSLVGGILPTFSYDETTKTLTIITSNE